MTLAQFYFNRTSTFITLEYCLQHFLELKGMANQWLHTSLQYHSQLSVVLRFCMHEFPDVICYHKGRSNPNVLDTVPSQLAEVVASLHVSVD